MAETQTESPVDWKAERAKNALEPGLYEQLLKEYPGIKIDSAPTKQAQATISYNGKQVSFGPRLGRITTQEIREQFGEPVTSSQNKIETNGGFNISRIDTKALNALDSCCTLSNAIAQYDGKPGIGVQFKDGYTSYIRTEDGKGGKVDNGFVLASFVMKTELQMTGKGRGMPIVLMNTWDDGTKEQIFIYRKDSGFNPETGKIGQ